MTDYSAYHWSEKARKYAETLGTIFNVKGRVNIVQDLPATGNKIGDVWLVGLSTDSDLSEYAWLTFDNITRWEKLGSTATSLAFSAITGSPNDNVALKNALDAKYDANNPNGYTSNVGTVTSVNNVSPVSGNVTLSIPTVNNPTITITQGGVTKGSFTLNQASGDTIALDAGGGSSVDIDNLSITKNTDDEIQTVGVIDQNSSTTAIKQWSGTKAQYDAVVSKDSNTIYNITDDTSVSSFANTDLSNLSPTGEVVLAGKVDLAAGVTQSDVDYVIESQTPTSDNNYTWYRLYKSGWVEQGGFGVSVNSSTSSTVVTSTINLLKQFSSTNYGVQIQGLQATTANSSSRLYVSTKNTSSFVVTIQNSILSGGKIDWEAKGVVA